MNQLLCIASFASSASATLPAATRRFNPILLSKLPYSSAPHSESERSKVNVHFGMRLQLTLPADSDFPLAGPGATVPIESPRIAHCGAVAHPCDSTPPNSPSLGAPLQRHCVSVLCKCHARHGIRHSYSDARSPVGKSSKQSACNHTKSRLHAKSATSKTLLIPKHFQHSQKRAQNFRMNDAAMAEIQFHGPRKPQK